MDTKRGISSPFKRVSQNAVRAESGSRHVVESGAGRSAGRWVAGSRGIGQGGTGGTGQGTQIEGGGRQHPLRLDIGAPTPVGSPCTLLVFEDTEDRLDQPAPSSPERLRLGAGLPLIVRSLVVFPL